MNWMINATLLILLTSITGAVLFLIWFLIGKLMEKTGFLQVVYELLKGVSIFWILPVAYLLINRWNRTIWGNFLFRPNRIFLMISTIFMVSWGIGFLFFTCKAWSEILGIHTIYRNTVPVDGEVYQYFQKICEELSIDSGKIDLVYDDKTKVPCLCGLAHYFIMLPNRDYTMDELRVIFLHELVHYKQKSHFSKYNTEFLLAFHFFNPFIWLYRKNLYQWSEIACDNALIKTSFGLKDYFEKIYAMAGDSTSENRLGSYLAARVSDMERRITVAKRTYRIQKKSRVFLSLALAVMLFLSVTGVSQATYLAGNAYFHGYFKLTPATEEELMYSAEEETVEYREYLEETEEIITQCVFYPSFHFTEINGLFYIINYGFLMENKKIGTVDWPGLENHVKQIVRSCFDEPIVLMEDGTIRCLGEEDLEEDCFATYIVKTAIEYSNEYSLQLVSDYFDGFAVGRLLGVLTTGELCYFDGHEYQIYSLDDGMEVSKICGNYFLTKSGEMYEFFFTEEGIASIQPVIAETCIDFDYRYGDGSLIILTDRDEIIVDSRFGNPDLSEWNDVVSVFTSYGLFACLCKDGSIHYAFYSNENNWQISELNQKYDVIAGVALSDDSKIYVMNEELKVDLFDPADMK